MADFKQTEQSVERSTGVAPDEYTGRVVLQVRWRGLTHQVEKIAAPEAATHYRMDRLVAEANVEIRRRLSAQLTGHAVSTAPVPDSVPRLWEALMDELHRHLHQTPGRFVLSPPGRPDEPHPFWRAEVKPDIAALSARGAYVLVTNLVAVGVGSSARMAVENLIRAFERREPIDG